MNIIEKKLRKYETLKHACDDINYWIQFEDELEYITAVEAFLMRFQVNNRRIGVDDLQQDEFNVNVEMLHKLFDAAETMSEVCSTQHEREVVARIVEKSSENFLKWILRMVELYGKEVK